MEIDNTITNSNLLYPYYYIVLVAYLNNSKIIN